MNLTAILKIQLTYPSFQIEKNYWKKMSISEQIEYAQYIPRLIFGNILLCS